jgi:hypothetical protein
MIRVSGFHSLRRSARFRAFDTRKHCTRTKYVDTRPDPVTPDGNERTSPDPNHQNECTVLLQETCGLKGFNPLILNGMYIYHRDVRSSSSSPLRAAAATYRAESIFVVEPSKSAKTQTAFSGHVELVLTHANNPVVSKKRGALGMD